MGGRLVFLGVLVVLAGVPVVVGVGMLSYARFAALAYYYGIVGLVTIVVLVGSYSVLIAVVVCVVVGVPPVVLRIGIAIVIAAIGIAASVAVIAAVVTTVVAVIVAIRMVPITATAVGASCGQG
jgi:hypothetical protein